MNSGPIVMGTGIVSIALSLDHERAFSRVWVALTGGAWLALVVLTAMALIRDRPALRHRARSASGLAWVAATAVLGSSLVAHGWRTVPAGLLVAAAGLWLGLSVTLVRHGHPPRTGSVFMLTVSVQSLSVLAALTATNERIDWLVYPAVAAFALGLGLYVPSLSRFDTRQLLTGPGDQWVAGGALAISALAAGEIAVAAAGEPSLHDALPALHAIAVAIWAMAMAWLLVLLVTELHSPRLRYHVRRWSTLFPVGMYAASSFKVDQVARIGAAGAFARAWTWAGVGLWLVLAAGLARRLAATAPRAEAKGTRRSSFPGSRR